MTTNLGRFLSVLVATLVVVLAPLRAQASSCTATSVAGNWAYTYTGTIFTLNGPLPAASVGHFTLNSAGDVTGSQARTVAGQSGVEDITGTVSVNRDCTASATINVFVSGQLQRTAELALVFDSNGKHVRMIFQSLTLPNSTNVPVVITIDGNKVTYKE